MSHRTQRFVARLPYVAFAGIVGLSLVAALPTARLRQANGCGGGGFFGGGRSVGGVSVDAKGVLSNSEVDETNSLRQVREQMMAQVPGDLNAPNLLRKISLRKLEAAIAACQNDGQPLPDEMLLLAGLQRVQYVFAFPEQHDIVLCGFAEGWRVDNRGDIVGRTTGRPVMALDDLLVALRSARGSAEGGITCSIDPTPEGLQRLRQFASQLTTIGNPPETARAIEQTLGPQIISVTGVPATSNFARVLVAADYRMKRLGMGFEPAPVAGMPSYIQMIKAGARGMQSMTPRWWMVPDYQPMLRDGDGLSWELRGATVKVQTEETAFGQQGAQANTGRTSPVAQQWADNMTAHYAELSVKEPIFGELRNCMDLAIVSALLVKEGLPAKVGHNFDLLFDVGKLPIVALPAPTTTDSKATLARKGANWVISASGGVNLQPWAVVDKVETSDALAPVRAKSTAAADTAWWWN